MNVRSGSHSSPVQDVGQGLPPLNCTRTYGLTPSELRAEIARCIDAGWRGWEICTRFECDCTSKDSSE